jgi:acyl-CoA thioesterase I
MAIVLKPGNAVEFIGDSITDCGRRDDAVLGLGEGFVRIIHDALRPRGVRVINRGIGGDRTGDLVARWRPDCLDLRPDVLTIMVGINDTWYRFDSDDPTPAEVFEKNYRHLITTAMNELDAQIVLIEPWLLPVDPDQQAWREDLDPKVDVVGRLAAEFGLTLLPLGAILRGEAASRTNSALAADGVHPTPLGHQVIAQAWLDLTTGP